MKKKLTAVALVVCMLAVMLVGASLAYFTDKDQVTNTFTVGNVKIDLYEYTDEDQDGKPDTNKKYQEHMYLSHVMPGDEIVKIPYIKNTGSEDAYVRVFVQINNHEKRNKAIDEAYENLGQDEVQGKYDYIFNGWGINNTKAADGITGYDNGIRGSMAKRESNVEGVEIIGIDSVRCPYVSAGYQWEAWNIFQTNEEKTNHSQNMEWTNNGYYMIALNKDSNLYVFYLKLKPRSENEDGYKLFDGLRVPTDFTGDQLQMFEGLEINIYADAIQAANFEDGENAKADKTDTAWYKAFTALEEACPMGWWNNKSAE